MSIQSRFSFTGTFVIPKETSKMPFFKDMSKDKKKMARMNFGVKESETNMTFVEAFDSAQTTIKTMNSENEKIEVKWEDRFDAEVIKTVANYKKYVIDLGEELGGRKEFISQYDAILHLKEYLPKYKGKILVTGQFIKEPYNGIFMDKYKLNNVFAVDNDVKSRLALTLDFYYNKTSVDKSDFKSEQKIYLDGYVSQYINKDEGNKFIPQRLVFNASKYDLTNEKHKKLFDYRMDYIDIDKKNMHHMLWDVVLLRGAEEVEFTIDMLSKDQRRQVELDIRKLDDFKPKVVVGDKLVEYRLLDPKLINEFANGLVDTEMKLSEFEEQIYVPGSKEESLDEAVNKAKGKEEANDEPLEDDDLF